LDLYYSPSIDIFTIYLGANMGVKLTQGLYNGNKPCKIKDQQHTTFNITLNGKKYWRYRVNKKSIGISLDTDVRPSGSLSDDRELFAKWNALVAKGIHPKTLTTDYTKFYDIALEAIEMKMKTLSNEKNKKQWLSTMKTYVFPTLKDIDISNITSRHIEEVLKPIWYEKNDTASKIRGRLEYIFSYAIQKRYRDEILGNPAQYKNRLDIVLPPIKQTNRHPALKYADAPKLVALIAQKNDLYSIAILALMITASRHQELLKTKWDWLDFNAATLAEPYTKTMQDYLIPIPKRLLSRFNMLKKSSKVNDFVFGSLQASKNGFISDHAVRTHLKEAASTLSLYHFVPHGFRQTFKNWAENTDVRRTFDSPIIEMCLSHHVKGIEKHYFSEEKYLNQRRELLQLWEDYLFSEVENG
jgi:integrase